MASGAATVTGLGWRAGRALHHGLGSALRSGRTYRQPPSGNRTVPATDAAARTVDPPLAPRPAARNPVVTASMLGHDIAFVADPFLWLTDERWHLFFEVYRPSRRPPASVAHASSSDRGRTWRYSGVVLEPDVHVAFPFVFAFEGEYYLLPDPWSERPGVPSDFTLYRAERFPTEWDAVATPISPDRELHDCVLVRDGGRWWALAGGDGELAVYHSASLVADDWTPHPDNPVVTDRPEAVRPAGRPVVTDEGFVLFFQDCARRYGERVWAYEVTALGTDRYCDRRLSERPVVGPAGVVGWNSGRMHHVDAWLLEDRWLCAVDGNVGLGKPVFGDHWALGFYEQPLS